MPRDIMLGDVILVIEGDEATLVFPFWDAIPAEPPSGWEQFDEEPDL